jgi:VanZ family protein
MTDLPTTVVRSQPSIGKTLVGLYPLAHFVGFMLAGILALGSRWPAPRWVVLLGLVAYAAGTEVIQAFVPRRTPEMWDLLLNLAGLATSILIFICATTITANRKSMATSIGR